MNRFAVLIIVAILAGVTAAQAPSAGRRPSDEAELRAWLENMIWYHRFSAEEIAAATGLSEADATAAAARFDIRPQGRPRRDPRDPLVTLPYPGGRHPRIGFLNGAIDPLRETKVSVFAPWDPESYVVVDVPEAIWSNLGLAYLAHTHVPTIWTKQSVTLEPLEWKRNEEGSLTIKRQLPNGISFAALVRPARDHVRMELTLFNGTSAPLSDLRVQNCVMLRGAKGFAAQTNDNKRFVAPYAACRSEQGDRWVITAWEPCHRAWGNPPCPCLHSDPKFPDCPPGESRRIWGWLSFYEGSDLDAELRRLDALGWRNEGS